MEMQNDISKDDVRKRSRFYQGLIDTPILKSGKDTRYKHLPSTVIIFITRDDIFEKDFAKYTFTEQCEEVAGLKLEDGTTKIFLNMTSKNGSQELDEIVSEVKESEEWEAVRMDILEIGIAKGMEDGARKKAAEYIEALLRKGFSAEEVAKMLEEDLAVVKEIAELTGSTKE